MDAAPDVADPILVNDVLQQLKSEGTFDQFRRDCLGDVDTKPAYQNLRQRVENYVSNFLSGVTWSPTMNKNQLRDSLRRQINQSEILAIGVERVIEQVVDPQIQHAFRPKLEEVVQNILKVELDLNSEMGLTGGISASCSGNASQPFSNQDSANSSQSSSYVSQAPSFTGHVSVSTPPITVSSDVAPPLPYEAPPLPSHSPPPLPEEAPPPPLPESVAPPPPPDEPPPAPEPQDMDIESTESMEIEETIISEPPQKTEPFKFMKNLLHKAKEKVKNIIGEKKKEEKSKLEEEKMSVESTVVEKRMQDLELETDNKNDGDPDPDLKDNGDDDEDGGGGGDDDEEDHLTDITVSSVHTSDLSSFTEGISSSSSSDLSDSDSDDELKKIGDVEMHGERSLSRCSSMATDSDKGSSKGSGRKSSNLALAISRYHSDSDEDMEKRQERRRKAAEAREERAVLRQQAREEHQKKIEQMKAERLAKKRKKALQEKSNTSDEEDADDRPGRKERRTRSIQLKEQMKEKLLEKKKEKKRMAAASHSVSDETLSPRKQVTSSKHTGIYRFDLVARKLKKPIVKYHYLLSEELSGEDQTFAGNKKETFRGPGGKQRIVKNKEKLKEAKEKLEEGELKETFDDLPHRPSDDSKDTEDNENILGKKMDVEINESSLVALIMDSNDGKEHELQTCNVQTNIETSRHTEHETKNDSVHESQKSRDVAVVSSSLKDDSQKSDDVAMTDISLKDESKKSDDAVVTDSLEDESQKSDDVVVTDSLEDEFQKSDDVTQAGSSLKDEPQKIYDVAVTDSLKCESQKIDGVTMTDINFKDESKKADDVVVTDSLKDESQKSDDVTQAGSSLKDETQKIYDVAMTDINLKDKSQKSDDVLVTDSSFKSESQKIDDVAMTDISLKDESKKSDDVAETDSSLKSESQKIDDVAMTDISLKDESKKSDDVAETDSSFKSESQKIDDVAMTDINLKDESKKSDDVAETDSSLKSESQKIDDVVVTDSSVKDEYKKSKDVVETDSCLKSESQKIDDVAVTESSLKDESQKSDLTKAGSSLNDASSKNIVTDSESWNETNQVDKLATKTDLEKTELMNVPQSGDDGPSSFLEKEVGDDQSEVEKEESNIKDHSGQFGDLRSEKINDESLLSEKVVQESGKHDILEENPPTPTQDEPSTLEEIAEVEPAAIPIYSLSPAAYQGPKLGSLFKVSKDDAERSAEQADSTASSPLSAISSGDLSGGEEKILEDEEPDEEGEIKESTESVTQEEKPNSEGGRTRDDKEEVHEGRYGMRSRRKINSPKYSDDEYLLYGFKKRRSSGSVEDKGGKETKADSRTRTADSERATRRSLRTDSLSAGKEEGEVCEQHDTKKRQKGSTEDSASVMPGRRQRHVPRRYSPSESVTGRRGQSPTRHSSNRYTEQQAYGERRTRRQSPPAPQRETGRSRRGATPPRRGLRRPSGDRASESYPPSKRRR